MLNEVDRHVLQHELDAIVAALEPLRRPAQAGADFGRQAETFDREFPIGERDGRRLRQGHRMLVAEIDFQLAELALEPRLKRLAPVAKGAIHGRLERRTLIVADKCYRLTGVRRLEASFEARQNEVVDRQSRTAH